MKNVSLHPVTEAHGQYGVSVYIFLQLLLSKSTAEHEHQWTITISPQIFFLQFSGCVKFAVLSQGQNLQFCFFFSRFGWAFINHYMKSFRHQPSLESIISFFFFPCTNISRINLSFFHVQTSLESIICYF